MQKGNGIRRVAQFVRRKSFYIVLGLCAVAIGISGYILFFTGEEPQQPTPTAKQTRTSQVSGEAKDVTVPKSDPAKTKQQETDLQQSKTPKDTKPQEAENEPTPPLQTTVSQPQPEPQSDTVEVSQSVPTEIPVFTFPVRGAEVQRNYSGAQLVFDETMGDWRTHNGTDFSCDEGDEVMAVLDGAVERIYQDGMMGTCILLDHGAGLQSLYCGVTVADGLREDQSVSAGQTLGRACGSILGESAQQCHVHLEMWESGQLIDPMSVLN